MQQVNHEYDEFIFEEERLGLRIQSLVNYEWNQTEIYFSNGEKYEVFKVDEMLHLYAGQQHYGELEKRIKYLHATEQQKPGILILLTDHSNNKHLSGKLTEDEIFTQSDELCDLEQTKNFIKENCQRAFEINNPLKIQKVGENYELVMTMETVLDESETAEFKIKVTLEVFKDIIEQESKIKIDTLGDKILIKKIQQKYLPEKQPALQRFTPSDLDAVTDEYYITKVATENVADFEFQIYDEAEQFLIGILEDGNRENLGKKTQSLLLELPEGKLRRGNKEKPIPFLPRPLLNNDQINLKVIKDKQLFYVSINGVTIPPIKIKGDFAAAFIVQCEKGLNQIFEFA